jgi:acyl carrier protein
MTNEQIVKEFISNKYKINAQNDTDLTEICEDSFARIELLFDIEKHLKLNRKIPENELLDIETIGDIIHCINKL